MSTANKLDPPKHSGWSPRHKPPSLALTPKPPKSLTHGAPEPAHLPCRRELDPGGAGSFCTNGRGWGQGLGIRGGGGGLSASGHNTFALTQTSPVTAWIRAGNQIKQTRPGIIHWITRMSRETLTALTPDIPGSSLSRSASIRNGLPQATGINDGHRSQASDLKRRKPTSLAGAKG